MKAIKLIIEIARLVLMFKGDKSKIKMGLMDDHESEKQKARTGKNESPDTTVSPKR